MELKIHPIQRNELINRIIDEIESCGDSSVSIHLAIRQISSQATGKVFRIMDIPNMINVNSFEVNPNDGFKKNEDRIKFLKAIKTAE